MREGIDAEGRLDLQSHVSQCVEEQSLYLRLQMYSGADPGVVKSDWPRKCLFPVVLTD